LSENATGAGSLREEALARALAAAHDALAAKIALIEAEQASGSLAPELAAQQAAAAQAVYERDCALARITADTGWQTWTVSVGCCTPAGSAPARPRWSAPRTLSLDPPTILGYK
jgi:hypothetical protein